MNYQDLFKSIQAYCENTFPGTGLSDGSEFTTTEQINTLIKQAENRIYNSVQFPAARKLGSLSTVAGTAYVNCPNDFLSVESFACVAADGTYTFLLPKDPSFIRQAYPKVTDTSLPKYYALFGPQSAAPSELRFLLGPTPNLVYSIELHYFAYPDSIVTAGTSWLGDNLESALLYACLVEAITFMKGEADLVALYDGKYKEALLMAKRMGEGLQKQDTYRNGQHRTPVI